MYLCCCRGGGEGPAERDGVGGVEVGEEDEPPDGGEQGEGTQREVLCGDHC